MKIVQARTRFAELETCSDGVCLSFHVSKETTFGSKLRVKELRQLVSRILRQSKPRSLSARGDCISAVFELGEPEEDLKRLMKELDRRVEEFRKERLHPRIVEELLGISSKERRRWIKDGRLPISGSGSFRRGKQVIQFPLHPPGKIALLLGKPDVIAQWRERDLQEAPVSDPRSSQPRD